MSQTTDDIRRVTARLRGGLPTLKRALVLEITGRVVRRTPVDTGRARGNWSVTPGIPAAGFDWNARDPAGTKAIAQAGALQAPTGVPVYVVNNLPYIEALEHGHSKQAPAGMVGLTAAEVRPLVEMIAQRYAGQG